MHTASRHIGIDMGHRVTNHGSKCRNVHGHRYTIGATISGELISEGASQGMVLDFSFLKEEMMEVIDARCDHGLCLWVNDPIVAYLEERHPKLISLIDVRDVIAQEGWCGLTVEPFGKLYIIDDVPTAECLAFHWFAQLAHPVHVRSQGQAFLKSVRVWETPNCYAEYSSERTK